VDGALIIDKPTGMTSHDVVQAVRRLLGEKRIGHLGTLDPFAGGVLVLLVGRATRLARFYRERQKSYYGTIRFGFATDTMDGTGTPLSEDTSPKLSKEDLLPAFASFIGPYSQRPPAFSAKKISGVPAYRLARRGLDVKLNPVPVAIHAFELLWVEGAQAGFKATVSSGTYLRSLVNDLGERLKVGAHLTELRRTSVGEFVELIAVKLEELENRLPPAPPVLVPLQDLLPELPRIELNESEAIRASHGAELSLIHGPDRVRLMSPQGQLIAIAERVGETLYHPVVVLVTATSSASDGCQGGPGPSGGGSSLLKTMLVLCGAAY
jgi:tRNA pseudouridine55 synthase